MPCWAWRKSGNHGVIHGSDPAVRLDPDLSLCNDFVNDDRGDKIGEMQLDDFDG